MEGEYNERVGAEMDKNMERVEEEKQKTANDEYWLELETPGERKARIRSLYIVHISGLVFALGFSIVLTGLLPYLRRLTGKQDDELLEIFGWMVAINPLGQMLFSPLLGWLSNKLGSIRLVMLATCCVYVLGNLVYSCLSLMPGQNEGQIRWMMMLAGRLLVGISSANLAPCRAYIAGATFQHERNNQIAIFSLFQTLGFVIGPAIQAAVTPIGCAEEYIEGELSLDMYTIPGWLSVCVGLLSLLLFLPQVFQESYVSQKEAEHLAKIGGRGAADLLDTKPDMIAVGTCLLGFFMFMTNYILLETIGVLLCQQQLGWAEDKSVRILGILMSIGAVLSLFTFASIGPLTRKFDERLVYLVLGIAPMAVGRLFSIPMAGYTPKMKPDSLSASFPRGQISLFDARNVDCGTGGGEGGCSLEWCEYTPALTEFQFYLSYVIAAISFPYCVGICQAIFSKVIGPRPQGTWMGLLTAVGSLARILAPLFASYVYEILGTYWLFGLCSGSLVIAFIVTLGTYKRLVPIGTLLASRPQQSRL